MAVTPDTSNSIVLLASGSNARGQLANGTLDDSHAFSPCNFLGCSPGKLPSAARRILQVASGSNHTLVLLERQNGAGDIQRELWGCGDGAKGQLGPTYTGTVEKYPHTFDTSRSILRPLDLPLHDYELSGYTCRLIASAWETTYVVCSCAGKGDVVVSMGANDFGDLGIGESRKGKEAVKSLNVIKFNHIKISHQNLDIGSLVIGSLAAGPHHIIVHASCPLVAKNTTAEYFVIGWGASRHGQLGPMPEPARPSAISPTPRIISTVVTHSHDHIISSSLGNQHSVFLHGSGRLSCLGSNKKGQLRDLPTLKDVQQVECTWNGTYAVVRSTDDDGVNRILATGSHSRGQLGRVMVSAEWEYTSLPLAPVQFPVTSIPYRIACGSEHVLALSGDTLNEVSGAENMVQSEAEVWGWGWNEHGNMGIGTTEDVVLPSKIWPSALVEISGRVVSIWAGCGTSWIALEQCN